MGGVKSGKFGKLEKYENDDETMSQSEEEIVQINFKRPREPRSRKAHDVGRCGRRTRARRQKLR